MTNETLYFKSGKNYVKAEWEYDNYPENPQQDRENIGKMVFFKNRNGDFGDEQVDNWREFFINQLTDYNPFSNYKGEVKFKIPSAEEAAGNPRLEKYLTSDGRFDKELFNQDVKSSLDSAERELRGDTELAVFGVNISGGIPLLKDRQTLSGEYSVGFETEIFPEYGNYSWMLDRTVDAIGKALEENFGIKESQRSVDWNLENSFKGLSESEIYEKWAQTKAAVVPIDLYIHSETTIHEASLRKSPFGLDLENDDGYIYNDGFAYIDKDNKEYRRLLAEGKSEKDAREWAEQNLHGEIQDYANYLEGDIHTLAVSYFNPKTNEWEQGEMETGILGGTLEQALKERGTSIDEILAKNTVFNLENSVNPEFKKETVRMYIDDVRKNLPDFHNSLEAAAVSVSKQWKAKADVNVEATDRLNRWEMRKRALKEYFKENGIDSAEKTFAFLAKETGFKEKNPNLPPLSIKDKDLKAYIAIIHNPNRSDNGGLARLLLVDEKNKSFAYFNNPSYIVSKSDIGGKITNLGSGKRVDEKAKELSRYGFKDADVSNEYFAKYQKHFSKSELDNGISRGI